MIDRTRNDAVHPLAVGMVLMVAVFGLSAAHAQTVLHVDDDAPLGGDGLSWETPLRYLQDALALAAEPGSEVDEIRIGQGVYKPHQIENLGTRNQNASFHLMNGLSILGGYAGWGEPDPDLRDPGLYETVLSGDLDGDDGPGFTNMNDNSYHVVTAEDVDSSALISGVTITSGYAYYGNASDPRTRGAGIYCYGATPTIELCIVTHCYARKDGAGMYALEGGSPAVLDCQFLGNWANDGDGGGISTYHSSLTVLNCAFIENSAEDWGGAIAHYDGELSIVGCSLVSNSTGRSGAAVYASDDGTVMIEACDFSGNEATEKGGGVYFSGGSLLLTDSTFLENTAPEGGGALRLYAGSDGTGVTITNCEFAGNSTAEYGGAILNDHVFNGLYIYDSLFDGNNAGTASGALYADTDELTLIQDCVFNNNTSGDEGGGAIRNDGWLEVYETTFAANETTERGGAIRNSGDLQMIDCVVSGNTSLHDGAGVFDYSWDGALITDCIFEENATQGVGGGLFLTTGAPIVERCDFRDNAAEIWGGGAYAIMCEGLLSECVFSGNDSQGEGAGLHVFDADVQCLDCTFTGNLAGVLGGGVYNCGSGTLALIRCSVNDNEAVLEGGGLCNVGGDVQVLNGTFIANHAGGLGGGLSNAGGGQVALTNCVMSGNISGLLGGALSTSEGGISVVANCAFSANEAAYLAGGSYTFAGGETALANAILWGNRDLGGVGEAAQLDADETSGLSVDYCCVQGWTGDLGGIGNFGDDPMLRDADGEDDIPGTADDDVRLSAGSSCIDAGDNLAVPPDTFDLDNDGETDGPVPVDLDDHARFFDDPSIEDTGNGEPPIVDIGAYEFDGEPVHYVGPSGGSWFIAEYWSGGAVPGPLTDIVLTTLVVVDGPNGVARDVIVVDDGALAIDAGSLLVHSLLVSRGGTLSLWHEDAALTVQELVVTETGVLDWVAGTIRVEAGTWTHGSALTIGDSGPCTLVLTGGAMVESSSIAIAAQGGVQGDGTLRAPLVANNGLLRPGLPIGSLLIDGDFQQAAEGTLSIEIRRLHAPALHDSLNVNESATLGGTLELLAAEPFEPAVGTASRVLIAEDLEGEFEVFNWPDEGGSLVFELSYEPQAVRVRITAPSPRLYVSSSAPPGGYGTTWDVAFNDFQDALDAADRLGGAIEEIWVATGTYVPSRRMDPDLPYSATFMLGDGLSWYGGFAGDETDINQRDIPANPTVLSGDTEGNDLPGFENIDDNVVHAVYGADLNTPIVIDGFIISGGYADPDAGGDKNEGAGLWLSQCSPTILNCTFTANHAGIGGGLYSFEGNPIVRDCLFEANRATVGGGAYIFVGNALVSDCSFVANDAPPGGSDYTGGGLTINSGQITVVNCEFRENATYFGGGICVGDGDHQIEACSFRNNTAWYGGGAIRVRSNSGTASFTNCLIVANSAKERGGGLEVRDGDPRFTDCVFIANETYDENADGGGAVYTRYAQPVFVNTLMVGNASRRGGAMFNEESDPQLITCTLVYNHTTEDRGGGLANMDGSHPIINSTILWANYEFGHEPEEEGQIYNWSGCSVAINYSCVHGWTGMFGGIGNIGDDPNFLDMDGPDNIPGNEDDDLRLGAGSPCIDAANNFAVPEDILTDLDGNPRFVDDPDTEDTGFGEPPIVDMGAYEFQVDLCPADFDGDGDVDTADLLHLLGAWGTPDGDVDGDGNTDTMDLLSLLAAWGECP